MSDLISRDVLLEEFRKCYSGHMGMENSDAMMTFKGICNVIKKCPSAKLEIIRCKDCKLFGDSKCLMCFDGYDWAEPDGYCHMAERKTDE